MADNSDSVKHSINFKPRPTPDLSDTGDLGVDSADNRLKYNDGNSVSEVLLQKDADAAGFTDAANVDYDNTTSGLIASDVQAAVDELADAPLNPNFTTAANVDYDNSTSGLTATEVQAAIDEVEGRLDTVETDLSTAQGDISTLQGDVSSLQTGKQDADPILDGVVALAAGTGVVEKTGPSTFSATNTPTVDELNANGVQARNSSGFHIQNQSGSDVAIFGAGGSTGTTFKGGVVAETSVQFQDPGVGTNTVTVQAPSGLASSYNLTLPANDGDADQFLKTDGSGNTSWSRVDNAVGIASYTNDAAFVSANGTAANGDVYYNTTDNVFRVYMAGAWATIALRDIANTFSGNNTFTGTSTFTGAPILTKQTDGSGGNLFNFNNTRSFIEFTGASTSLSGLSNRVDGQVVCIINSSGGNMTIVHEGSGATAANRFDLPNGQDLTVSDGQAVLFVYSSVDSRWHSIGGTGSGSGSSDPTELVTNQRAETNTTGWAVYSVDQSCTFQDTGDTVTSNSHGLQNGDEISFYSIVSTTGISTNTRYFVINATTNTFQVATTRTGAALPLTTNGSGRYVRAYPLFGDGVVGNGDLTGNLTFTRTTTTPILGTASFLLTKSAASAMGVGASTRLTLANMHKARVMQVEFDYIVQSGTFAAGEPGATGSLGDVTVWLVKEGGTPVAVQPTTFKLFSNSTGVSTKFVANFQTDQDATTYMLCLHVASPSTSAWALEIDNVSVKPSQYVYGTPITDWTSYTPTFGAGFGTVTNTSVRWRRVGDSLELQGTFTTGTVGASTSGISLPSGLVIDTAKLSGASTNCFVGLGARGVSGTNPGWDLLVAPATSTTNLFISYYAASATSAPLTPQNISAILGSSENQSFFARVPIAGWSSSVQTSDQADSRVVAFRAGAASGSLTGSFATLATLASSFDTHAAFSAGVYTVPVSGVYDVKFTVTTTDATATAGTVGVQITVNGVSSLENYGVGSAVLNNRASVSGLLNLRAGDTVAFRASSGSSAPVNGTANWTFASMNRLSQASLISATELVTAQAASSAGTVLSSGNTIIFGTENWDSHSAYDASTGIFTAPVSGTYEVGALIRSTAFTPSASNQYAIDLAKNGTSTTLQLAFYTANAAVSQIIGLAGSTQIKLNAGETVRIIFQASSGSMTLLNDAKYNYINIKRIGI